MSDKRTLEDHNSDLDLDTSEKVACGHCGKVLQQFALVEAHDEDDLTGDWVCGMCFIDLERNQYAASYVPPEMGWQDVRSFRTRLMERCDWTQTLDVSETVRNLWAPIRQELRDIPESFTEPQDAWNRLLEIETESF